MRTILTSFLTIVVFTNVHAQVTADSVQWVVESLFTAMYNSDTVLLKRVFSENAILQTISVGKDGKTVVQTEPVSQFVASFGKISKGDADERIHFEAIHIDGNLAAVWTPYRFYFKGNFSHCGVNSFQLVRSNGQWKIQYIIDTRRREACD